MSLKKLLMTSVLALTMSACGGGLDEAVDPAVPDEGQSASASADEAEEEVGQTEQEVVVGFSCGAPTYAFAQCIQLGSSKPDHAYYGCRNRSNNMDVKFKYKRCRRSCEDLGIRVRCE